MTANVSPSKNYVLPLKNKLFLNDKARLKIGEVKVNETHAFCNWRITLA
jgi:hypothetical protein